MGRKHRRDDELVRQAQALLIDEWKDLKSGAIGRKINFLERNQSNDAIIALGASTVRQLLKSLKGECRALRKKCCPKEIFLEAHPNESGSVIFDNVVEDGARFPTGRLPCRCPQCRGVVLWPAIYVGSRGFSYECELQAMPIEVSCHLPSSPSGRTMRLIRVMQIRVEERRTRLGWKKGAKRNRDW
jgi:hypothetical protein